MSEQLSMQAPECVCVRCRASYIPVVGDEQRLCPLCKEFADAQERRIGTDPGLPFGRNTR